MKSPLLLVNAWGADLLTSYNYVQLGITTVAYSLETLLIQPGLDRLMNYATLRDYVGFPDRIVLDRSCLMHLQEHTLCLRSPRNGATICLEKKVVEHLCQYLKVDAFSEETSALPLMMAARGEFWAQDTVTTIDDQSYQYDVMQTACPCPTCYQGFSKAYLHHLYETVPLLAQRFIAFHNVVYWLTYFTSDCKTR